MHTCVGFLPRGATLCSPFRARKSKSSHRASSQHTDTLLPRLAGTRLPYEPLLIAKPGGLCELLKLGISR